MAPAGRPPTRPRPTVERERLVWAEGRLLVGVDEAGRGPLAGPVVAAAVVFPPGVGIIPEVRDSKTLPPARRLACALRIRATAIRLGVGAASTREIDRLNIRVATAVAMQRALRRALGSSSVGEAGFVVLVDGLPVPELGPLHQALVDGDALCYSVAAAGIIAKTVRDRIMTGLAPRHPGYGWERNMGYGTGQHLAGLALAGPTPHHRMSFAPLAQRALFP